MTCQICTFGKYFEGMLQATMEPIRNAQTLSTHTVVPCSSHEHASKGKTGKVQNAQRVKGYFRSGPENRGGDYEGYRIFN